MRSSSSRVPSSHAVVAVRVITGGLLGARTTNAPAAAAGAFVRRVLLTSYANDDPAGGRSPTRYVKTGTTYERVVMSAEGSTARGTRSTSARVVVLGDGEILERPEPLDLDADPLARPDPAARLARDADARRRPGRHDVARLERHDRAQLGEQPAHAEHHLRRVRVLQRLAVDRAADRERLRVGDLVARDERRSARAVRVPRLSKRPLRGERLIVADAHVVEAGVARDLRLGVVLAHVAAARPDDEGELGLVVDAIRRARDHDRRAVADERVVPFREDGDAVGERQLHFLGMVAVVQPDADQ